MGLEYRRLYGFPQVLLHLNSVLLVISVVLIWLSLTSTSLYHELYTVTVSSQGSTAVGQLQLALGAWRACAHSAISLNGVSQSSWDQCWYLSSSCQFEQGNSQEVIVDNCPLLNTFRVFAVAVGCAVSTLMLASLIHSVVIVSKGTIHLTYHLVGVTILTLTIVLQVVVLSLIDHFEFAPAVARCTGVECDESVSKKFGAAFAMDVAVLVLMVWTLINSAVAWRHEKQRINTMTRLEDEDEQIQQGAFKAESS